MPSGRSALGNAPTTSARPPVFANGVTSEATKRTFSGAGAVIPKRSARVNSVVHVGEDVVAPLDVRQPALVHAGAPHILIELVELQDVLVDAAGGVGHRRPRLHDEGPVTGLGQHQL